MTVKLPKKLRNSLATENFAQIRQGKESDIALAPVWLLNADLEYYKRKLSNALRRKEEGKKVHARYSNYEANTKQRIATLEKEIKSRRNK